MSTILTRGIAAAILTFDALTNGGLLVTEIEALAFADTWAACWNRVDIEAVAAHFADDATLRSPLALRLTGQSTVRGRRAIHHYWIKAYGHVSEPNLKLEAASWDARLRRLTVWWRAILPGGMTRACEFMDFDTEGLIQRSEAYYGA